MQENTLIAYVRIADVKPPIPTGEVNGRNEPVYNLRAIGHSICGSIRDPNTGTYSNEARELDLVFTGITGRQQEFIAKCSEILVNGASVISYMTPTSFPQSVFGCISLSGKASNASDIVQWLLEKIPETDHNVRNAIALLVPEQRRITIARVKPGQWSLKASVNQINTGATMQGVMDDLGGL